MRLLNDERENSEMLDVKVMEAEGQTFAPRSGYRQFAEVEVGATISAGTKGKRGMK